MVYTLDKYHEGGDNPATKAWDNVQEGLKCCGVYNSTDWVMSHIPSSCHKVMTPVNSSHDGGDIYHEGCLDTVGTHLLEDVYIIVGQSKSTKIIGILISCLQYFSLLFVIHYSGITWHCCNFKPLNQTEQEKTP